MRRQCYQCLGFWDGAGVCPHCQVVQPSPVVTPNSEREKETDTTAVGDHSLCHDEGCTLTNVPLRYASCGCGRGLVVGDQLTPEEARAILRNIVGYDGTAEWVWRVERTHVNALAKLKRIAGGSE